MTAYVGRLHKDTTEENLSKLLKSFGIANFVCKKLSKKNSAQGAFKRIYHTAAFFVSCSLERKHILHNEDTWPVGCELCDWIWYNKK